MISNTLKVADLLPQGRDTKRSRTALDPFLKRANIIKPQDAFEKKPDNFEPGPWKPLLTRKPHAKRSLEDSLKVVSTEEGNSYGLSVLLRLLSVSTTDRSGQQVATSQISIPKKKRKGARRGKVEKDQKGAHRRDALTSERHCRYTHPYEIEILESPYPRSVYEKREPQMYLPVESTKAIWVDTWEGVLEMLEELKQAKEIAIDLEHHDLRTYVGLLSLMQISTRGKDWIVDTLVPWRHKLEVLNEVFADPNVVKVWKISTKSLWRLVDIYLHFLGHARSLHGYYMASEGSRFVCRWPF